MTVRLLNKITKGFSESVSHVLDKLTHRELSVLLMLSEGSNPNEIADRLKLDRKTVETHRRRVKEKLEFSSISELIRFATQWRQTQGRLLPETFRQETTPRTRAKLDVLIFLDQVHTSKRGGQRPVLL